MTAGKKYRPGVVYEDLLPGVKCVFVPVLRSEYPVFLGAACKYYDSDLFPALQCVWSDDAGRFPGDDSYDVDRNYQSLACDFPEEVDCATSQDEEARA